MATKSTQFAQEQLPQVVIELTPGLLDRHESLLDCVAASVYQRGLGKVAADLNIPKGNLSQQLSDDSARHFSIENLERLIEKSGDLSPVLYLVERFLVKRGA